MPINNIADILLPACIAGIIVASIHVPLGLEVLRRGIIFIDLAIAQIASLGVVVAKIFIGEGEGAFNSIISPIQGCALLFALLAACFFSWLEKHFPEWQEAFIGSTFIVSSSLALLLLANHPHGGEEIKTMLAGQIIWTNGRQLLETGAIYGILLVIWFLTQQKARLFYGFFAIACTLSVQMVGVYLVFTNLILPALGAQAFPKEKQLYAGYGIAITAIIAGLLLSLYTDLPTGPFMVCCFAITSILFALGGYGYRRGVR